VDQNDYNSWLKKDKRPVTQFTKMKTITGHCIKTNAKKPKNTKEIYPRDRHGNRIFLLVARLPYLGLGRLIVEVFGSQAVRHTKLGRTPQQEGSSHRRDLYLKTKYSQDTRFPCPGGIWNLNSSKRAAADLRFRPRGHQNKIKKTHKIKKKKAYRSVQIKSLRADLAATAETLVLNFNILLTVHLNIFIY
jgi:hypothetical protein